MKNSALALFFFLFLIVPAFSQDSYYVSSNMSELISNYKVMSAMNQNGKNEMYTGSPYENDEFGEGNLVTKTKHIFKAIPLRLNIYNNDIEFKSSDGKIYALAQPELFDFFTIGESTYKYIAYAIGRNVEKAYFKVIEEGKATLLAKAKVVFNQAQKAQPYKDAKPASFERQRDEYFIRIGENPAQKVDNKKDIENLFGNEAKNLIDYAKEKKLKLSDQEGLRELVNYYNSK